MDLLVDLNARDGTTIVAVLHDLGLAAHFFPRVAVMTAAGSSARPAVRDADAGQIRDVFGVDPALVRLPVAADVT